MDVGMKKFKLTIELVPKTAWFTSLYQIYKKTSHLNGWRRIKKNFLKERDGNVGSVAEEIFILRFMNFRNMMKIM